jgi:hypothetical protein
MAYLTRIPPLPDCEKITKMSGDRDRLICAQTEMRAGSAKNLIQAVQLTASFPDTHLLYADAYPILLESSERLLKKATEKMHEGDLPTAIEWASQIPVNTPLREQAQAEIWNWQQEWKRGEEITGLIEQVIAARDWATADNHLQTLKLLTSDYWVGKHHDELLQAKELEQTAWVQIEQARGLANTGDPENIGQALVIAQRVNLTSQAWQDAQEDIDRWGQNMLLYSFQRWEVGDVEGAIAAAQKLPPDPDLAPEAQDLIRFSHAKQLADSVKQNDPNAMHLFKLMEAIGAAESISPDSTFYEAAQQFAQTWKAELADLRVLNFAKDVASLRQAWAYEYASQLAWTVELERPRRLQAQTMIAYWEDEVERIADRPILLRANALAKKATIPALQAAITEARNIPLGRALRIDAQTAIAAWTDQIEIIQDQPILNEANTLATQNKLKEAIAAAQQIPDDRALFEQAQTMIKEWTQTLQIQEDSPILERAKSLAYRGSLTEAINTAAQIAPGRALYGEARNAIKLWESERAYIWAQESAAAAAREEALTETDVEVTPAEESAPSDAPESFEENPPPEPDYSEPIPDSELPPPE